MKPNVLVEVAVESLEHALMAEDLGADRIELCSALSLGGLTPSYGLIESCLKSLSIPLHVMIRCRPGGFEYSDREMEIMLTDAHSCAKLGIGGLVFGFLDSDRNLDVRATQDVVSICKAHNLNSTFHRAFDVTQYPVRTIQQLVDLGIDHLLTSGQEPKAIDGIPLIASLVNDYGHSIDIMAGSGVNEETIYGILQTGVSAVHMTAHTYEVTTRDHEFDFGQASKFNDKKLKSVLDVVRN